MLAPMAVERDEVDEMLRQWRTERPELDSSGMAVVLRILSIAGGLSDRLKQILEPVQLAPWEYDVLSALRRVGQGQGLTPKELCASARLTSGAMTHRIDRLEERGLVRRRAARKDRRSITVLLTARGRTLVDGIIGARMADAGKSLAAISKKERAELARLLRQVNQGLAELDDA